MGSDERQPESQSRIKAFREGLQQLGWIEGRNAQLEVRWAVDTDRIHDDIAEMIALATDVIVATGTPFVDALHKATRSIPIVFVLSNDPVGLGHIASMAKPGGNITGFTFMELSLIPRPWNASQIVGSFFRLAGYHRLTGPLAWKQPALLHGSLLNRNPAGASSTIGAAGRACRAKV